MKEERTVPSFVWILSTIAGGVGGVVGALCVILAFVLPDLQKGGFAVILTGIGLAAMFLGTGLTISSVAGQKGLPSPNLHIKWGWGIFLLLTLILIVVAILVPADWHDRPLFAAIHLSLVALPAGLLLSLVTLTAGRQRSLTLREFIITAAGGASTIVIALPLEITGLALGSVAIGIVATLLPGGAAEVKRLVILVEQWAIAPPTSLDDILSIAASPVVLAILALTLAVVAPVIEEFVKTLVMGVMGIWRRPGLTRAFLWGAVCGMGFAIVEGITNGANGLGEVWGWLGGMGSRALATSMHMLASGIIGLGWGFFWHKRRWILPLAYIVAVSFHGLWNLNVVAIIGGIGTGMQSSSIGLILAIAAAGLQFVLALCTPVALIGIPFILGRYESKAGSR